MALAAGAALPFSDDILAEILIRLPALEDLGRACASCPAFRRVITGRGFLRRLHTLHLPSLLGFHIFSAQFHPVEPPYPAARAARAVADAADFGFLFLPGPGFWMVRDACGGRFVLHRDEGTGPAFNTIAVCDPLFRRYVLLPPIPDDLAAAVECDVFFAPCGEREAAVAVAGALESFRVIWMAQCRTKLVAFIFSSASRQWRAIASPSWGYLNPGMAPVTERSPLHWLSYAYGCFYWLCSRLPYRSNLIVLDMGRMEFYRVRHPSGYMLEECAMVELEESRHGLFNFISNRPNHGEGASEWVLENRVLLSPKYKLNMLGVADGKLLLHKTWFGCISLDFKTSQLQWVRGMIQTGSCTMLALYTGYPPSLSLPTI
ncbi:hypothetical protein PAHAL_2G406600 [Panicum hallii]|uniref:F-box domain-containing protein n=1 Tax=Panicum hallii TaxID=206008 RepID=A0A2S3H336_9POAL|nr:hypothetical protein PAHAL_2G406600 [Panicum hallii]